eukprot:CAMPEP_0117664506 /NCGR_PEP_ID=MMETSP0804-20121206/9260_1 /TAXON_ID=1074897 /ORGANISM="Tetraselmis astigmatica, Strain CCMP880" /LENGTH=292 /DNA_ID=CAMNT_0005471751 /DNA_START=177 /DNA_END=1055 /DNA_ORIENTATION=+
MVCSWSSVATILFLISLCCPVSQARRGPGLLAVSSPGSSAYASGASELDKVPPLPLPDELSALGGKEGQEIFGEAFSGQGNTRPFFPVIQELMTQDTESYCGATTLLTILNALGVDPGRKWTPSVPDWDWYGDITMLKGLSWNGICKGGNQCCMAKEALDYMGMSLSQWVCLAARNNLTVTTHMWGEFTIDDFRSALQQMDASSLVALNFDRRGVKQYGGGHFSPIAGYNSKRDMVLVTDVARFKYPPWWAPVEMVFNSMSDSFNGTQRGFAVVTPGPGSPAGLFPASLQVT